MKKKLQKLLQILKWAIIGFFVLSIGGTFVFRFVPIPITPLMIIRCGEQVFHGNKLKLKKNWEPIKNISPYLEQAVMASEDQLFPEHWGFDFTAIEKALKYNDKKKGKKVKGGSTISQQTAKNVFLWPGRSWVRKGFEAYFTLLIEVMWSKERIMEVYLNVIEMGPGIYGAEAAAKEHFHTTARRLTAGQCALIAAVLPNPLRWNAGRPTGYIQMRQQWILRNMSQMGHPDIRED